jgi:hypothetical protein
VERAIECYNELAKQIFAKKLWWRQVYDYGVLENNLKEVINKAPLPNIGKDAPFKDNERRCKTFVITTTLDEGAFEPVLLRLYERLGTECSHDFQVKEAFPGTIWKAGRATSAVPTFFDPVTIECTGKRYTDGATIANNPTKEAIYEALSLWPERDIALILGLGTGPSNELTLSQTPYEYLPHWFVGFCECSLRETWWLQLRIAFYSLQRMVCTKIIHREAEKIVNSWFIKQNSTKQTPSSVDEMSAEHGENQP